MDKIILEINNQIHTTIALAQVFFKNANLSTLLLSAGFLYIIFFRKWPFKKTGSFLLVIFLMFILMLRIEDFLKLTLSREGFDISIGISRTIFFIIATAVFFYLAAIRE